MSLLPRLASRSAPPRRTAGRSAILAAALCALCAWSSSAHAEEADASHVGTSVPGHAPENGEGGAPTEHPSEGEPVGAAARASDGGDEGGKSAGGVEEPAAPVRGGGDEARGGEGAPGEPPAGGDRTRPQGPDQRRAEEEAQSAAEARRRALLEAELAETETLRRMAEERAALEGMREQVARYEAALARGQDELDVALDRHLALRRRLEEQLAAAREGAREPSTCDAAYHEATLELGRLRARLRLELAGHRSPTAAPRPPPTRLVAPDGDPEAQALLELRRRLEESAGELEARARDAAWRGAETWRGALDALGRKRIELAGCLSPEGASELFAWSPRGLVHVAEEIDHIALTTQFRAALARRFLAALPARLRDPFVQWEVAAALLKLALGLALWRAWRQRADPLLLGLQGRALAALRSPRLSAIAERLLALVLRVRRPLEGLLAVVVVRGILGEEGAIIELEIAWTVLEWLLAGQAIIGAIDALAGADRSARLAAAYAGVDEELDEPAPGAPPSSDGALLLSAMGAGSSPSFPPPAAGGSRPSTASALDASALRLRSLFVAGRFVVAAGLVLVLAELLVGEGAIHRRAVSLCAWGSLPVALVLLRWWRPVVLARLAREGEGGPRAAVAGFLARHASRWYGLVPVAAGAAVLAATAVYRRARRYLSGFEASRRVLAYLFRREVTRRAEAASLAATWRPLAGARAAHFDPAAPPPRVLNAVEEETFAWLLARVERGEGGIVALVGERGGGKTTLLRRLSLAAGESRTAWSSCRRGAPLGGALEALSAPASPATTLAAALDARRTRLVIVDDAHRMVRPSVGGLDELDATLSVARGACGDRTWVLSLDAAAWPFLDRARGREPLFDRVILLDGWSEEMVGRLLRSRTAAARLRPSFEELLPGGAGGPDRALHLLRAELGYYRLVWDHADGNPAVSLHVWRRSLWEDDRGLWRVRLFDAPDLEELERLPDAARFVLRALIQLEEASAAEIEAITLFRAREIEDALRYALAAGFLEPVTDGGTVRYRVTWTWYRAVTRFLRRKHLLLKV